MSPRKIVIDGAIMDLEDLSQDFVAFGSDVLAKVRIYRLLRQMSRNAMCELCHNSAFLALG